MAYWHWGRVFLCAALAASQETFLEKQQHALDKIAEQIRNDGAYPSCAAPQLASCGTSPCSGSECRTFRISFTLAKEVTSLFEMKFVVLFIHFLVKSHNATFSSFIWEFSKFEFFKTFPSIQNTHLMI